MDWCVSTTQAETHRKYMKGRHGNIQGNINRNDKVLNPFLLKEWMGVPVAKTWWAKSPNPLNTQNLLDTHCLRLSQTQTHHFRINSFSLSRYKHSRLEVFILKMGWMLGPCWLRLSLTGKQHCLLLEGQAVSFRWFVQWLTYQITRA